MLTIVLFLISGVLLINTQGIKNLFNCSTWGRFCYLRWELLRHVLKMSLQVLKEPVLAVPVHLGGLGPLGLALEGLLLVQASNPRPSTLLEESLKLAAEGILMA